MTKYHLITGLAAVVVLAAAVAFSRNDRPGSALGVRVESRNPWTSDRLNNDPESFQFAIVSDRTGGHRARIFSRAIARLNLLQPEFVVSVGDLIEGGNKKPEQLEAEWKEFDGYVKQLTMPFFYLPGNHDTGAKSSDAVWQKHLGRRYYHFVYRNVLFLCLNTEDPPGSGPGNLGKEQVAYARKALAANPSAKWTIVLLHKPIWTATNLEKRGWLEVEKALADRPYTVFCGHVHRYRKFVRQGRNYYQLATTGGGSRLRGVPYGEFDHIVWATMKKDGPVFTNILLDSILPDDLQVPPSDEKGSSSRPRLKTQGVRGVIYFDGSPVVGAQVSLSRKAVKGAPAVRGDAFTGGDGSFVPNTYGLEDGLPTGTYVVTVTQRRPLILADGSAGPNLLPTRYASPTTSPLVVEVVEGKNDFVLDLTR